MKCKDEAVFTIKNFSVYKFISVFFIVTLFKFIYIVQLSITDTKSERLKHALKSRLMKCLLCSVRETQAPSLLLLCQPQGWAPLPQGPKQLTTEFTV